MTEIFRAMRFFRAKSFKFFGIRKSKLDLIEEEEAFCGLLYAAQRYRALNHLLQLDILASLVIFSTASELFI